MDPPTHALVGRLAARVRWPERERGRLVNYTTVMSLLPDIDSVFPGEGVDYLVVHRGWTHSIPGVLVMGLVAAWIARRLWFKERSLGQMYTVSVAGLLLHVLFDVVTSYGTPIFTPFSDYRAAIDLLFIIDPYFSALLIAGLVLGWRAGGRGYRLGAVLASVYLAANLALTGIGYRDLYAWAADRSLPVEKSSVLPQPFSPWHRRGIVESGPNTYLVDLTGGGARDSAAVFPRALVRPDLQPAWRTRTGSIYAWFARHPVVTGRVDDREDDATVVEDLQFKLGAENLGWLGSYAAEAARQARPDFLERRMFYIEIEPSSNGAPPKVLFER